MTARLLPEPDALYSFLQHAFRSAGASRSRVERCPRSLEREAGVLISRLVPGAGRVPTTGAFDRLVGLLWELSGGDWEDAQRVLRVVGRPRREDVLVDLATALRGLAEQAPSSGPVQSEARAELQRRRAALPTRGTVRPPRPARLDVEGRDPRADSARATTIVARPTEHVVAELRHMPGLGSVAEQVDDLVAELEVAQARRRRGLPADERPLRHLALIGPPGTGKTTVARMLAELYAGLGLLAKPQVLETGRIGLVGMYSGHTSHRTSDAVARALGGVLFVDEAYSLSGDAFGQEALAELVRLMESHRNDLVVIFAGYSDEMRDFLLENPGLTSRIGTVLEFAPYTSRELVEIAEWFAVEAGYLMSASAREAAWSWCECARIQPAFGNARAARSLVDEMRRRHARRVRAAGLLDGDALFVLEADDVPSPATDPSAAVAEPVPGYV